MFDILPTEEVGDFEVKAKFMGVEMEKVQLHFQVNISSVDSEGAEKIPQGRSGVMTASQLLSICHLTTTGYPAGNKR